MITTDDLPIAPFNAHLTGISNRLEAKRPPAWGNWLRDLVAQAEHEGDPLPLWMPTDTRLRQALRREAARNEVRNAQLRPLISALICLELLYHGLNPLHEDCARDEWETLIMVELNRVGPARFQAERLLEGLVIDQLTAKITA